MQIPSQQPNDETRKEQIRPEPQSVDMNEALRTGNRSDIRTHYPLISATSILITASLRHRLQLDHPDWSITPQQRALVDHLSTARLTHEKSLSDSSYSARAIITEARGLEVFSRCIHNLARSTRNEPLLQTGDKELGVNEISPDSSSYQNELLGSLWAIQAAFLIYRDNEKLFGGLMNSLHNNLQEIFDIFQNETLFNQVMFSMLRSGSHSAARNQLLQAKWLGLHEDDLPSIHR